MSQAQNRRIVFDVGTRTGRVDIPGAGTKFHNYQSRGTYNLYQTLVIATKLGVSGEILVQLKPYDDEPFSCCITRLIFPGVCDYVDPETGEVTQNCSRFYICPLTITDIGWSITFSARPPCEALAEFLQSQQHSGYANAFYNATKFRMPFHNDWKLFIQTERGPTYKAITDKAITSVTAVPYIYSSRTQSLLDDVLSGKTTIFAKLNFSRYMVFSIAAYYTSGTFVNDCEWIMKASDVAKYTKTTVKNFRRCALYFKTLADTQTQNVSASITESPVSNPEIIQTQGIEETGTSSTMDTQTLSSELSEATTSDSGNSADLNPVNCHTQPQENPAPQQSEGGKSKSKKKKK